MHVFTTSRLICSICVVLTYKRFHSVNTSHAHSCPGERGPSNSGEPILFCSLYQVVLSTEFHRSCSLRLREHHRALDLSVTLASTKTQEEIIYKGCRQAFFHKATNHPSVLPRVAFLFLCAVVLPTPGRVKQNNIQSPVIIKLSVDTPSRKVEAVDKFLRCIGTRMDFRDDHNIAGW